MAILSNSFVLPATIDYRAILEATRKAALTGTQYGANAQLSPQALNIASAITSDHLRRTTVASNGYVSLSIAPSVAVNNVIFSAQTINLGGKLATLASAGDAGLSIDMSAQPTGQYAVIVEWFESVVQATTAGAGLPPASISGITSSLNKPASDKLFPGGSLDRATPVDGIADAALRQGTTVAAARFTQVQYKVRLAPDVSLIGQVPTTLGSGVYVANPDDSSGLSVRASDPSDYLASNATPKTSDGYFYAAKLAVIVKAGSVTAYTFADLPSGLIIGQAAAPATRNLGVLTKTVYDLQVSLSAAQVAAATALAAANAASAGLSAHILDATDAHLGTAIGYSYATNNIGIQSATNITDAINATNQRIRAREFATVGITVANGINAIPSTYPGTSNYWPLGTIPIPANMAGLGALITVSSISSKTYDSGNYRAFIRLGAAGSGYVYCEQTPAGSGFGIDFAGSAFVALPVSGNISVDITTSGASGLDFDSAVLWLTLLEV